MSGRDSVICSPSFLARKNANNEFIVRFFARTWQSIHTGRRDWKWCLGQSKSIEIQVNAFESNSHNIVQVVRAIDTGSNDKTVAIKIQLFEGEQKAIIDEEYRILRDHSEHPNLPNFYGVYRNKGSGKSDEIWFVLEVRSGSFAN